MKIIMLMLPFISLFLLSNLVDNNEELDLDSIDGQNIEESKDTNLLNKIIELDSLLFDVGFNQIDTFQVNQLTSEDFEFYHDEHGITDSKATFVGVIESLRVLPFKTWRKLIPGSTEIFPMYRNNRQELYGVIQNGVHEFYQQKNDDEIRKTNIAQFTHLWLLEDGDWKLKRVLSFDHQVPTLGK